MTDQELKRRFDGVTLQTKKFETWVISVTATAVSDGSASYRCIVTLRADDGPGEFSNVTFNVTSPMNWPAEKVLKRVLDQLDSNLIKTGTIIYFRAPDRA